MEENKNNNVKSYHEIQQDRLERLVDKLSDTVEQMDKSTNQLNTLLAVQQQKVETLVKDVDTISSGMDVLKKDSTRLDNIEKTVASLSNKVDELNKWRWGAIGIIAFASIVLELFGKKVIALFSGS